MGTWLSQLPPRGSRAWAREISCAEHLETEYVYRASTGDERWLSFGLSQEHEHIYMDSVLDFVFSKHPREEFLASKPRAVLGIYFRSAGHTKTKRF